MANSRPSGLKSIVILPPHWKWNAIIISFFVILILMTIVSYIMKTWNLLPWILLDESTNTYSLSNFQAFAWTIVLIGSYFYVAICNGILLRNGDLPEFKLSLIGLMGISYVGLFSSNIMDKYNPPASIKEIPPSPKNLFCNQNGIIDFSKLQLFTFTIVAIIVYVFNLFQSNALEGLPEIPQSLHLLLVTSQGGYIGGKITGNKMRINQIIPTKVTIKESKIKISIIGHGFQLGTRIVLKGFKPIESEFVNSSNLECTLPLVDSSGYRDITLISPDGSIIEVQKAIEFLETSKIQNRKNTKQQKNI